MTKWPSRTILLTICFITVWQGYLISQLNFDYDFENFFPLDDPELSYFIEYRGLFENDNDFLLIGLKKQSGVLDPDFLRQVDSLCEELSNIDGVDRVVSPTRIKEPVISAFGIVEVPILHWDKPELYALDSVRLFSNQMMAGNLISFTGKSLAILLNHTQRIEKDAADKLMTAISQVVRNYQFEEYHIAGKIYAQQAYIERMKVELLVFITSSALLVIAFLYISFRSWAGIWIPILIVVLTLLWTMGVMSGTGQSINLLTTIMPSILFVIATSDVVHLLSKYIEELRKGFEKTEAIKRTIKEVGIATLLTSVTTAMGFLTLVSISIQPVRQLGIYTATGVFLAFIITYGVLPALLFLLPARTISRHIGKHSFWENVLGSLFRWILRNQAIIIVGSVIVLGGAVYFATKVKVDVSLLEDLSEKDPLKQDFLFFENEFAGVRPFEMALETPDSSISILDYRYLTELNRVDSFLKADYLVKAALSPLSLVQSLNKSVNGGLNESFVLPETKREYENIRSKLKRILKRPETTSMITVDGRTGRYAGKIHDTGSAEIKIRNARLEQFYKSEIDTTIFRYHITGTSALIDQNNEYLVENMLQGLSIGFLLVAIISGLLFRSIRMAVISLVPNVLPLLLVGGIMGIAGVSLQVSTSIIFSIAFGIAVDDTIHFITRLKLEIRKGRSVLFALKRTFLSTGRAIIITSVILVGGFLTLIFSAFTSTFYTGLLISLTLLFAVCSDLLLLPVLILWFYKVKKTTKS